MNTVITKLDELREKNNDKKCEVPYCETIEKPCIMFDDRNITCRKCNHFTCSSCTSRIWKGEWSDETFYKPKIIVRGMTHQVFTCPFCRASFDRVINE
jgi:hypothetical protein